MWANKTGSIHLQVMCMPTPLRVWIMFLKGDREPWLLLAKISWERGPREGMLSTFSSLCCQFSVWLWEGNFWKGTDVYSSGSDILIPIVLMLIAQAPFLPKHLFEYLSLSPCPDHLNCSPLCLTELGSVRGPFPLPIYSSGFNIFSRPIWKCTINIEMCIVFDLLIPLLGISPIEILPWDGKNTRA